MKSDRREELLSAALDGDLSDAERAELDRLLDSDEARQDANDYTELHSLLGKLAAETPPDSLHDLIAGQVQLPLHKAPEKRGWQWLLPGFRYAIAVATGALAAVVVLNVDPTAGISPSANLTGSMAPAATRDVAPLLGRSEFAGDGFEGRASLSAGGPGPLLDLEFAAARPVEIAVRFGGSGLRVATLSGLDGALDSISLTAETLTLRGQGRRRLQVQLRRAESSGDESNPITLEISSNGELLDRGKLQLDR